MANLPGHGDLEAGPDDDRGQAAPELVAGVEDRRAVRGDNVVHDDIQKPFEVVGVFGGSNRLRNVEIALGKDDQTFLIIERVAFQRLRRASR